MRGNFTCPLGHTSNDRIIIVTVDFVLAVSLVICQECGIVFSDTKEKDNITKAKEEKLRILREADKEEKPKSPTDPEIIREVL